MKSVRNFGFKLVFNVFDLENSTGCENDSLSVYNGAISDSNLITKRCGKQTPDLLSTTSQLTAQFLSNYLVSGVGFRVSVYGKFIILSGALYNRAILTLLSDIQKRKILGKNAKMLGKTPESELQSIFVMKLNVQTLKIYKST